MRRAAYMCAFSGALVLLIAGCHKSRPAKFQLGDRVKLKFGSEEGRIVLRTRLSQGDRYFVRFPSPEYVRLPVRDREILLDSAAEVEREFGYRTSFTPWHEEGAFSEDELEATPK